MVPRCQFMSDLGDRALWVRRGRPTLRRGLQPARGRADWLFCRSGKARVAVFASMLFASLMRGQ